MKNKKGFTLIELLATIVILGILMMFAYPTVLKVVDSNKRDTYVEDAKKFITSVDYQIRSGKYNLERPKINNCIVISLQYLESSEFETPPGGGEYDFTRSFVVLKNVSNEDVYYVRLMEHIKDTTYTGVLMGKRSDLKGAAGRSKVESAVESQLFVVNNANKGKVSTALSKISVSCSSIEKVYYYD